MFFYNLTSTSSIFHLECVRTKLKAMADNPEMTTSILYQKLVPGANK